MADFPVTKKTWADLVDNTSPANSSDINSAYAEITAIEDVFLTDSTSLDASTDIHGFLRKLSGSSDEYMNGIGEWGTPATGSGGSSDLIEHGHTGSTDGGAIKLDALQSPDDSTSLNASTDTHGLLPKLDGSSDNFFNGLGAFAKPRLDLLDTPADTTSLDASTDAHGLLPKLDGTSDNFLNGKGEYAAVQTATTDTAGIKMLASSSDLNAGTTDNLMLSTNLFTKSNYGIRFVYAPLNGSTALAAGDKTYFPIPVEMTGWNLVEARATCGANTSTDATVFTVKKGGGTQTLLSTNITIDPALLDSLGSSDQPVISSSDNPVTSTDIIECAATSDCGAGMTYAGILTGWQLP